MRSFAIALLACVLVSSCSKSSSSRDEDFSASNEAHEAIVTPTIAPAHRYDFREGDVYGYISDVSEEDRAKGKAAGDVIMFRYYGDQGGIYRLRMVDAKGREMARYECASPCIAIKVIAGGDVIERIAYSPDSVIGSAYQDALSNQLAPVKESPKPALSGWAGSYDGTFEGGATGAVTIKDVGEDIGVKIDVASERCVGQISFTAPRPKAGSLIKRFPVDDSGNRCELELTREGDALGIDERGCAYYHGAECSFNGATVR